MGLLLGFALLFWLMVSVLVGLLILGMPQSGGQHSTTRKWDQPAAICALISAFLCLIATWTFGLTPTGPDSMVHGPESHQVVEIP